MAEAELYPGAKWTPLGAQTETRMTGHDILCLHTMVGYLVSTDRYFRISNGTGYSGTESHYGVGGKWGPDLGGLDGAVWQWQDRAFQADANLNGGPRVISIETADNAPALPEDIAPWTPKQCEAIAQLLAWESTPAGHAKCPSTWTCHKVGIPLELIPDTKPGRRGVGYHRQGIEPWLVDGGVQWSKSTGKGCPTPRRIAQIPAIITRAKAIRAGTAEPPEEDMPTAEEIAAAVWQHEIGGESVGTIMARLNPGTAGIAAAVASRVWGQQTKSAVDSSDVSVLNLLRWAHLAALQDTVPEAVKAQLDMIHATIGDEDAQTDRIEAAVQALGSVDALADLIADAVIAALPDSESIDRATVVAGVREALGSLDEEPTP